MAKKNISGIWIDNVTMEEAVADAMSFFETPGLKQIVTPNAEICQLAYETPDLLTLINNAALVVPDGSGVVLAAKLCKTPLREKVAGIDLAGNLLDEFAAANIGLYLLGAKPETLQKAAASVQSAHPGLRVVGSHDGYFADEAPVVEDIRRSGAQALFVCLGAPKQEFFIDKYREQLGDVRLAIGLGGVFDNWAGEVKRAPNFFIKLHIEFLYRLFQDPRRFRRMMRIPKYLVWARRNRVKIGE